MSSTSDINIFWFRRDLRLNDNHGLYEALQAGLPVQCIFIFDRNILDELENRSDARVEFIHDTLLSIKEQLNEIGADLWTFYGTPEDIWKELLVEYNVNAVFLNRDYEPYAKQRDESIESLCANKGVQFNSYKDHVIFESSEVLKDDGDPYVVFTPYKRKWLERLTSSGPKGNYKHLAAFESDKYLKELTKSGKTKDMITLSKMGFKRTEISIPPTEVPRKRIKEYGEKRDFPAIEGTSRLGIHFRFGTISIRQKAANSMGLSDVYLSELIWRDFYSQILDHFPKVVNKSFREKYDNIEWRNNEEEFKAWCEGKTGYPLVDAGMRELNQTGYMHNRVRMVTASFLTKHLLIDWRWGEAYFAQKLLDYDLASNNGGWQWAAGSGTDAAPYFRIFNPESQMKKFDKNQEYIKQWIEEWGTEDYPDPIVDHKEARERCLNTYKAALN